MHVGIGHTLAIATLFRSSHFSAGFHQDAVALNHKVGCALLCLRHVLRHLGHMPACGDAVLTSVFMQGAVKQGKQRGLAGAIAADQTDLFAGRERGRNAVEQDFGATP